MLYPFNLKGRSRKVIHSHKFKFANLIICKKMSQFCSNTPHFSHKKLLFPVSCIRSSVQLTGKVIFNRTNYVFNTTYPINEDIFGKYNIK